MAELIFDHSEEWIEKLTCPTQELTLSERDAIARHVITCPDCYHMLADYAWLERLIQARSAPELPPGLPPKLLDLWREEATTGSQTNRSLLTFSHRISTETPRGLPPNQYGRDSGNINGFDSGNFEPMPTSELTDFEQLIRELGE